MAVVLALGFASNVSASDFKITEIVVNEIAVYDTTPLPIHESIAAGAGDTLFITVTLKSDSPEEKVSVEAVLKGLESGTIRAESSMFDMTANRTYAKYLTIKLPESIRDKDFDSDLTLKITAESDGGDAVPIEITLTLEKTRHNLLVLSVQAPNKVNAGDTVLVEASVRNKGTQREDDVFVRASIPELGITASRYLGDLVTYEKSDEDLTDKGVAFLRLDVPKSASSGTYTLEVSVYTRDGVAKTVGTRSITVTGTGKAVEETSVLVDATSKSIAREQGVVYKVTLVNLGDSTQTYTANIAGVNFGTSSVNPGVLTLTPGSSGEFNVFVYPSDTATLGMHAFTVVVKSGANTVDTLNLNADVTGTTGGDKLKQNLIVVAIILVVILIILAIIIAVVTGRRHEESEEKLY